MGFVLFYLFGVAIGGLFSLFLWGTIPDIKAVEDFTRKMGVSTDQIIAAMSLLWPITIAAGLLLTVGYSLHSLCVVIKALIITVRGRQ